MFTTLVESIPAGKRSNAGAVVSFVAHYGLVLGVLYTSAGAAGADTRPRAETLQFVQPEKPEPKETPAVEPTREVAPLPSKPVLPLMPMVEVPEVLPEVDLSRAPTDPDAYSGKSPGVSPRGKVPFVEAEPRPDNTYREFEVDKPVVQAATSALPTYPDILRQAGIEGEALVSFVVDTLGRVDLTSFKVIRTTHEQFAAAVRSALPRMRFIPAETWRGKVRQLVQQPFSFTIVR